MARLVYRYRPMIGFMADVYIFIYIYAKVFWSWMGLIKSTNIAAGALVAEHFVGQFAEIPSCQYKVGRFSGMSVE